MNKIAQEQELKTTYKLTIIPGTNYTTNDSLIPKTDFPLRASHLLSQSLDLETMGAII